jgi:transposase
MARPATPFRLTPEQHAEVPGRLRQAMMAPRLRVRLECVQLRDQGHLVPEIAQRLAVSQATVRRALGRVRTGGLDGLADRPRGGRPPRLSQRDLEAVEDLLRQAAPAGQVWTVGQLAAWLARHRGVRISRERLGALLRARGCRWTPATPAARSPRARR